jgi:hypothetical protein
VPRMTSDTLSSRSGSAVWGACMALTPPPVRRSGRRHRRRR